MSIGVMVYRLMKLPKEYPNFNFVMEYKKEKDIIDILKFKYQLIKIKF